MAFVYGSYTTVIDSFRPKGTTCPDCKANHQLLVEKTVGVIHIMFIPIIPISISNIFTCKSCGYQFDLHGLNSEAKEYFKPFKSKKRVPVWFYSGPILILLILGFYGYTQNENEHKMSDRLLNGNQKQIIEYETDNGEYSTMRTLKITSDSVWLNYNSYQIKEYKFIGRITDDNLYYSDTTKVSFETLKEMVEDGKVKAVYSQ